MITKPNPKVQFKMPESKIPPSMLVQATTKLAHMVQSTLVSLDSVWSSGTMKERKKRSRSRNNSPKTSPISFRMAGVLLPPSPYHAPQPYPGLAPQQAADQLDLMRWAKHAGFSADATNTPLDYDEYAYHLLLLFYISFNFCINFVNCAN